MACKCFILRHVHQVWHHVRHQIHSFTPKEEVLSVLYRKIWLIWFMIHLYFSGWIIFGRYNVTAFRIVIYVSLRQGRHRHSFTREWTQKKCLGVVFWCLYGKNAKRNTFGMTKIVLSQFEVMSSLKTQTIVSRNQLAEEDQMGKKKTSRNSPMGHLCKSLLYQPTVDVSP